MFLLENYNILNSQRLSGILLHPTSFPSKFGIGDLGSCAYNFIDFLVKSNQKIWQVLPLGHTGYGDSPYQSFSSFAGQPLIISPQKLIDINLLNEDDVYYDNSFNSNKIDYGYVIKYKFSILRKAYSNFVIINDFNLRHNWSKFCDREKKWLDNYALFMALKDLNKGSMWINWDNSMSHPTKETKESMINELTYEINFYKFIQFIFYEQWSQLKKYANDKGIYIIGDLPIFTSFDSSDVWANKQLFSLDSSGYPIDVAGVPPDYFSKTGQLWGNPLYNWEVHKETNYEWWVDRLSHVLKLVDIVRIDHFRGFESYWSIPYGNKTAINGTWKKGPSKDLFDTFVNKFGNELPIIAEDLGIITEQVRILRDNYNLPGMKILQFAFETTDDNEFLPYNYNKNTICYTGTHDNDTTRGWYKYTNELNKDKVRRYMNTDGKDISWDFIRTCFGSVSNTAIVPLQDILCLDNHARMNLPGSSMGNWQWRYTENMLTDFIIYKLKSTTKLFGRNI
ncbi:MAG: 4-alpha-glucanotransferase [Vallitalea sp.]|nr:4-alpha-glucanotransferase [Vallitalea sp.]